MKILQINKQYHPVVGGVETVVRQLATNFADEGQRSRVLAARSGRQPRDTHEMIDGVEVDKAGSFGTIANTAISPTFPLRYREAVDWADVVHFHAPSPLVEVTQMLLGVETSTPVVVTFHCDPAASRFAALNRLYEPFQHSLLERADAIVVTAPQNGKRPILEDYQEKLTVIPLAADVDTETPSEEKVRGVRRRHGVGERPIILSVGRLVYYKGLDYLIRAVEELDVDVLLVGKGTDRERLEQLAQERGVADRVHFAGFVEDEMLPAYYEVADVFALASTSAAEAFGIVQVEAMAHGLPIVNTDLPSGVPFVSQDGETGLTVAPADVDTLREALGRLMADEQLCAEFGEAARCRAQKFTESKMIRRHLELYDSLL